MRTATSSNDGGNGGHLGPIFWTALLTLVLLGLSRLAPPVALVERVLAAAVILASWLWFPVFIGLALAFAAVGYRQHFRNGLPAYRPWVAAAAASLLVVMWVVLAIAWAGSWTSPVSTVAALGLAAACLALGLWAHTEAWRVVFGDRVGQVVIRSVRRGRFSRTVGRRAWGSHHCLASLEHLHGEQERMLSEALRKKTSGAVPRLLLEYEKASDALYVYLSGRWAPAVLAQKARDEQKMRLAGGTLTALLAFTGSPTAEAVSGTIAKWRARLSELPDSAYRQMLELIFDVRLGRCTSTTPTLVDALMTAYRNLDTDGGVEDKDGADLSAHTWLALAPEQIELDVVIDVWLWMRRRARREPVFDGRTELVEIASARSLRHCYEAWADQTPEGWKDAIEGRIRYLAAVEG